MMTPYMGGQAMRAIWRLILVTAALAGCSMKEDIASTDAAVARFHQQLDAGKLDAIVQGTGPDMKAAPSAAMFGPILAAVHRKLGKVIATQRLGFNDQETTSGHFTTVVWHTRFEHGEGDERFTFRIADGRASLAGYNINSPALILG